MVDGSKLEDQKLVDRAQSGDLESFSALVERYHERAVHAALSMVGNMEDARDLAQEAFVKSYENLERFKSESRFYTWYYRILTNTCRDFLRKKKLRKTFSFWFGKDEEGEDADLSAQIKDSSPDAGEVLHQKEFSESVHEAMERLPFRQKSVFTLRYMEGMPLDEIAETLGITEGAVKAHLWQAGQKMKEMLKDRVGRDRS